VVVASARQYANYLHIIPYQRDNHASNSSLNFLWAGCSSWWVPNQQCQSTKDSIIIFQ